MQSFEMKVKGALNHRSGNDPAEIIGVSDQRILQPEAPREVCGYVPNVVFTCGAIIHHNASVIPYAMSDFMYGMATVKVKESINRMHTLWSCPSLRGRHY